MNDLEWLNLAGTDVGDAGLERLTPLKALRRLSLTGTRVTVTGLKSLKLLPRLGAVDLGGRDITAFELRRTLPQTSPRAQAILAELMEKTELDFTNQPLSEAFAYLMARHEIEIQLDVKSLEEDGISTETPITCELKGPTLHEALATILDPLELKFVVRHEVLLIGAKSMGEGLDLPELQQGQRLSPVLALALLRPVTVTFADQPLSEVVEYLKVTHGVDLEIDQKSLVGVGVPIDTPITFTLANVSLKSALELLLNDFGLTCVASGDKLIIRARERR